MTEMRTSVSCRRDVRVKSGLNTDKSWTLGLDDLKCEVLGGYVELHTRAS